MPDPHRAPREAVVSAQKMGKRGRSVWVHELACGHKEQRSRKSIASSMGCTQCLASYREAAGWSASGFNTEPTYDFDLELGGSLWISECLGVPAEMIQAVYSQKAGREVLTGFSVWVPMDAVGRNG
jgi:hypothetical protein